MSGYIGYTFLLVCAYFSEVFISVNASRILVVVPTPMFSHQIVFRPYTQELVRRGHHVVVLTTDPAFPVDQTPQNLTEINVHDLSYKLWIEKTQNKISGKQTDGDKVTLKIVGILYDIFLKQLQTKEVRNILLEQQFDLVVTEYYMLPVLALAHIYRAPAVLVSTFGIKDETYEIAGVPTHPILYPDIYQSSRYNLSPWKQVEMLCKRIKFHYMQKMDDDINDVIRKMDLGDILPVQELRKNVVLQFVNMYSMWEGYRPMTLNVVRIGGLHCMPPKALPVDLKSLMDSSKNGVIYMSFGNQVNFTNFPAERIEVFTRVFADLPYDVLWKWKDAPEGLPNNVHTFSWLPQADLLHHEKILLFITQGGLQSTDEALRAGVPLLGIPLASDQWVNVENYERLGVGLRLELALLTGSQLKEAIEKLIKDKRYRERSKQLIRVMEDQPQSSLERAVWWTERAIRLRDRSLETPTPPLTWDGLIQALIFTAIVGPLMLIFLMLILYRLLCELKCLAVNIGQKFVRWAHGYFLKYSQDICKSRV